jgi:hypothetical protein
MLGGGVRHVKRMPLVRASGAPRRDPSPSPRSQVLRSHANWRRARAPAAVRRGLTKACLVLRGLCDDVL